MTENDLSLKDVYTEIGTNYRVYTARRVRILAGYVTVLATLSAAYWKVGNSNDGWSTEVWRIAIAVTAIGLTLVVCKFDRRNHDLADKSKTCGVACEKTMVNAAKLEGALFYHAITRTDAGGEVVAPASSQPTTNSSAIDRVLLGVSGAAALSALAQAVMLIMGRT